MSGKLDSTAHAAAVAKISGVASHEAELRAHLDEIVKGPAFKGSHRSQAFLRHVVERALHGDPEDLRERSIGIALFGRDAAYDTADDAIVRVTASDVRKRLLQHYGTAGADSRIRISLPPGSYVPEFSLPAPAVEPPPAAAPAEPIASRSRRLLLIGSAVALLVLIVAWLLISRRLNPAAPLDNVIQSAFPNNGPVQIVVADDGLILIEVLLGRRFTLQEYENLTYLQAPEIVQKYGIQRFWGGLSNHPLTNIGDLQNADHMAASLRARNREVVVRHARQMHTRDFRNGNFILLGSSVSNPWAGLFPQAESNFPYGELPTPGLPEVILNKQPRAGEPSSFVVHKDDRTGDKITYARVSLLPNLTNTGRVLLIEGQSMSATEMSGGILVREDSSVKLRKMLELDARSPLPELEMILEVTEQNEIGERVELVAARKLERKN